MVGVGIGGCIGSAFGPGCALIGKAEVIQLVVGCAVVVVTIMNAWNGLVGINRLEQGNDMVGRSGLFCEVGGLCLTAVSSVLECLV